MERSKSGEPIYRYPDQKAEWTVPVHGKLREIKKFEKFITTHIGEYSKVYHEIISRDVHIDIYIIEPNENRDFYTLVTSGMSFKPMNTPKEYSKTRFAEIMISLPSSWKLDDESLKSDEYYWPIHWLKFLTHFVHDNNAWLAPGHTIPNGDPAEPFASNTKLSGILLLPSILFGNQAQKCKVSLFKDVHLYALHPLIEDEMQLKLDYGISPLLDKFDEKGISEVIDINRPSVLT